MSVGSPRRPRLVLITGAPGSGKTTLGTRLSLQLQLPFLARDDVRRGLFFSNGGWTERPGRVPTPEEHTADAVQRAASKPVLEPADLPVPSMGVDTTDGYDPSVEEVIAFVIGGR